MGTGWEYFNNICRAVQAGTKLASGALGLLVVVLLGWGVMQIVDASRASQAAPATAPHTTPASVAPQVNSQFTPVQSPGALVPTPVNGAAPAASVKSNPQFAQPSAASPTSVDSHALPSTMPNPQFAPKHDGK